MKTFLSVVLIGYFGSQVFASEAVDSKVKSLPTGQSEQTREAQNFRTLQKVICDQLYRDALYSSQKIDAPTPNFLNLCKEATNYEQIIALLNRFSASCTVSCEKKHPQFICGRNSCADTCFSEGQKAVKAMKAFDLAVSQQKKSLQSTLLAKFLCSEYFKPNYKTHEKIFRKDFLEKSFEIKDFKWFHEFRRIESSGDRLHSEAISKVSFAVEPRPSGCDKDVPKIEEIDPSEIAKALESRFNVCKESCSRRAQLEVEKKSKKPVASTPEAKPFSSKDLDCLKSECISRCTIDKEDGELGKRAIEMGLDDGADH